MVLSSPFHSFREALQLNTTVGGALDYILGLEQFMEEQHIVFDTPKVKPGFVVATVNRISCHQHLGTLRGIPIRIFHATVDPVCPISGSR